MRTTLGQRGWGCTVTSLLEGLDQAELVDSAVTQCLACGGDAARMTATKWASHGTAEVILLNRGLSADNKCLRHMILPNIVQRQHGEKQIKSTIEHRSFGGAAASGHFVVCAKQGSVWLLYDDNKAFAHLALPGAVYSTVVAVLYAGERARASSVPQLQTKEAGAH